MQTMSEVRMLHLEFSSRCNARCPMCKRNYHGFPYNAGYEETDLSLSRLQQVLAVDVLSQLEEIWVNGNYGDFVMNPESVALLTWLRRGNQSCRISISTNGSARDRAFWQDLGGLDLEIWFCLDGLRDTHHLYRIDTNWDNIITNAKTFMAAGGRAVWSFTEFHHNRHQIDQVRELAQQLGFDRVEIRRNQRGPAPVYDRQGRKIYTIDNPAVDRHPDIVDVSWIEKNTRHHWRDIGRHSIDCEAKRLLSVYIGATGSVAPCCHIDMVRPGLRAGRLPVSDDYLQELMSEAPRHVTKQQPWFPMLQASWSSRPHGVCQRVCGTEK